MDTNLLNLLAQRQMGQGQPQAPAQPAMPIVPPNPTVKVPQQAKRWENTQKIIQAYQDPTWSTNPVLLRALLGHR